jgi:quercetin dioxygenase-like cupin family protein
MELSPLYVLPPGATRRADAILPFKALAADTGGAVSVLEFELGPWESGPVLHVHNAVDEALYVLSGRLEAQLDEQRLTADPGSFVWVPRGTRHAFANAGPDKLHVLALGMPGGIEELFAEQAAYFAGLEGPPDPDVLQDIGRKHGSPAVGPPIRARAAPGTSTTSGTPVSGYGLPSTDRA